MSSDYRVTTLKNGVRIASVGMPHMQSATVGIWTAVGARHESKALSGVSHFVEHLMFKGTTRRNAKQITEAVEGVGGYLNAFTTEDHTCYYAKAGANHLATLCDVLADMYLHSEFAPVEIEREREVIREEILMYRDQPAQYAQELLSATLWPNHPLGRALTGTIETTSQLQRKELLGHKMETYNGRTTVVAVAGRVEHDAAVALLAPALGKLAPGRIPSFKRVKETQKAPQICVHTQDTEQTHLAMGFHTVGRLDPRRFALKLLSVILGENMSSRLFQKLREKHGLCYSVSSGMSMFEETGLLSIAVGLDPDKLPKALRLILSEIERISQRPPTAGELQKAKDYSIGQTLMGLESTSNHMMWVGDSMLGYKKILDPAEIERRLLAVTREEISEVARQFLTRALCGIAVVGSLKDDSQIRACLG
jgi:predicted Zn-dependent peptidase